MPGHIKPIRHICARHTTSTPIRAYFPPSHSLYVFFIFTCTCVQILCSQPVNSLFETHTCSNLPYPTNQTLSAKYLPTLLTGPSLFHVHLSRHIYLFISTFQLPLLYHLSRRTCQLPFLQSIYMQFTPTFLSFLVVTTWKSRRC